MFNFAAGTDAYQRASARTNMLSWTEASQPGRREGGRQEERGEDEASELLKVRTEGS